MISINYNSGKTIVDEPGVVVRGDITDAAAVKLWHVVFEIASKGIKLN